MQTKKNEQKSFTKLMLESKQGPARSKEKRQTDSKVFFHDRPWPLPRSFPGKRQWPILEHMDVVGD